jgi:hypothetical protein
MFCIVVRDETYWFIRNSRGAVEAKGGYDYDYYYSSYQTYNEQICLPADSCYTFTLYDEEGDG